MRSLTGRYGLSVLHVAGCSSLPYGHGDVSGPSHASSHSTSEHRRLPTPAHMASASTKRIITAGSAPGLFGHSYSSMHVATRVSTLSRANRPGTNE